MTEKLCAPCVCLDDTEMTKTLLASSNEVSALITCLFTTNTVVTPDLINKAMLKIQGGKAISDAAEEPVDSGTPPKLRDPGYAKKAEFLAHTTGTLALTSTTPNSPQKYERVEAYTLSPDGERHQAWAISALEWALRSNIPLSGVNGPPTIRPSSKVQHINFRIATLGYIETNGNKWVHPTPLAEWLGEQTGQDFGGRVTRLITALQNQRFIETRRGAHNVRELRFAQNYRSCIGELIDSIKILDQSDGEIDAEDVQTRIKSLFQESEMAKIALLVRRSDITNPFKNRETGSYEYVAHCGRKLVIDSGESFTLNQVLDELLEKKVITAEQHAKFIGRRNCRTRLMKAFKALGMEVEQQHRPNKLIGVEA